MGLISGYRRRRRHHHPYGPPQRTRRGRRRGSGLDDCGDCGDCSPFMLSPLLLLLQVLPGALRAEAVDPWVDRPDSVLARVAARLIRSYQLNVSVPRARPVCSMVPTCSRYGLQAVSRHGVLRGGLLTARRLRRCGKADSLDPVPPAR